MEIRPGVTNCHLQRRLAAGEVRRRCAARALHRRLRISMTRVNIFILATRGWRRLPPVAVCDPEGTCTLRLSRSGLRETQTLNRVSAPASKLAYTFTERLLPILLILINRTSMPYGHDQHDQPLLLQLTNDAVILHPIPPQSKLAGAKRFAEVARVFGLRDALIHIIEDLALDCPVELLEVFQGSGIVLNRPGQVLSSLAGW